MNKKNINIKKKSNQANREQATTIWYFKNNKKKRPEHGWGWGWITHTK